VVAWRWRRSGLPGRVSLPVRMPCLFVNPVRTKVHELGGGVVE
jgi:hypothetical protein